MKTRRNNFALYICIYVPSLVNFRSLRLAKILILPTFVVVKRVTFSYLPGVCLLSDHRGEVTRCHGNLTTSNILPTWHHHCRLEVSSPDSGVPEKLMTWRDKGSFPSPKLTANALESGWLEYEEVSFWGKRPILRTFAVSFTEGKLPILEGVQTWCKCMA